MEKEVQICAICPAPVRTAGLCHKHYNSHWWKNKKDKTRQRIRDRKRVAAWAKANPERVAAKQAAFRKANPSYDSDWAKAHPERRRVSKVARRSREAGASGSHTADQVKHLFAKQKGSCPACLVSLSAGYHQDHILPLSLGGSNDILNIQLLCPRCNVRKNALHPVVFMQRAGFLL